MKHSNGNNELKLYKHIYILMSNLSF